MRKLHTTFLGIVCLCATSSLFSQSNPENDFTRQVSNLYHSSNADSFFTWFTSPTCSNMLYFLMFASGLYFMSMLTLFLLISREVIKVKENAFLHILLEDWLKEEEKVIIVPTEEVESSETEDSQMETIIQLDLSNLDILNMDTESAKMAVS